ncbi:MAG: 33 kDa chaperonin [Glaciecola sp. HTCC2999]|jgi:molecular chaperone Hsp33|uniref:Hsp33 family molecular chaperone HslO n=1 Tax=Glaciecola sp. HTCC2999 TaxID=455436 RepID=UPI0000E10DEF|nr:Hsp33 family molecular chaperone HslO [Glaciecola sp. HTCC2999]CAI8201959.1 MAG: 33 kDa chaperonin [Glaciecola sp. HTCC2999]
MSEIASVDQLQRFLFNQANVRGELVQLKSTYQHILDSYAYPPVIQTLLGELMAATALLNATLKFEGEIGLQIQSEGIVKYAVVNGTHDLKLRGVARWDETLTELPESFSALFSKGYLVITITPKDGERYQGIVGLDQDSLAACIEEYFLQSEQLMTQVRLFAQQGEKPMAGGTLLQVLPTSSEATNVAESTEFGHIAALTDTLKAEELFSLEANDVMYRLYHQEEVEVFTPADVKFECHCSRESTIGALQNIAKEELLSIIAEEGAIKMNCQFCHTDYVFDAMDVETIHSGFDPDASKTAQ